MTDTITLTGTAASNVRHMTTSTQHRIAAFTLTTTRRRYDSHTGTWHDDGTNDYHVIAHGPLAGNAHHSIREGDRLIVIGTLRIRPWAAGDRSGRVLEVEATAIGHDLAHTPARTT